MRRKLNGDIIDELYAGEQQDIFVLSMLGTKNKGTFLDIGCCYHGHPDGYIVRSNTALLEKYRWKGIGIDLQDNIDKFTQYRPNTHFIKSNALDVNYSEIFEQNSFSNPIDYLSIDLDGAGLAFSCLKKVMDTKYEFKVVTFEHDAYRGMENSDMNPQRELMKNLGYILVRQCDIIEDFWINPKYISKEIYTKFIHHHTIDQFVPNTDNMNTHFWKYCSDINYDFEKLYQ
jgi:hypothetical protein